MEETPETPATTIPVALPEPTADRSAVEDGAANAAPALAAAPEAQRDVAVTTRVAPSAPADAPPTPYDSRLPVVIIVGLAVVIGAIGLLLVRRGRKGATSGAKDGAKADAKSVGDMVEIYVGNLSYDMTEDQFRKEFEKFGVVKSARIIGHRTSGKSKGYGFVEMPHRKEALVAIKALNNRDVMGRKLRVNEARNGMPRE